MALDICDEGQEVAHELVLDGGVPEREVRVDLIPVLPADFAAMNVAGLLEVGEDPIRRAFGDAGRGCELGNGGCGISRDGRQNLSVVRDERPRAQIRGMSRGRRRTSSRRSEGSPYGQSGTGGWSVKPALPVDVVRLLRFAVGGR